MQTFFRVAVFDALPSLRTFRVKLPIRIGLSSFLRVLALLDQSRDILAGIDKITGFLKFLIELRAADHVAFTVPSRVIAQSNDLVRSRLALALLQILAPPATGNAHSIFAIH